MGIRSKLYSALDKEHGLRMLAVPRSLALRLNHTLGKPLASESELESRANANLRLRALRSQKRAATPAQAAVLLAPVTVYFERDRGTKEKLRMQELLTSVNIEHQFLDVQDDEAMRGFVCNKAKVDLDRLPVAFVADHPIGTYDALVQANLSGELGRLIRGSKAS
jgi:hypothetical protein